MGRNKRYSGYRAFQFLEPGVDYKEFRLREEMPADMIEWVPLTKAEDERFESIMKKSVVISLHDHPSRRPENIAEREEYGREGR
jgi:membrane dipeptidase